MSTIADKFPMSSRRNRMMGQGRELQLTPSQRELYKNMENAKRMQLNKVQREKLKITISERMIKTREKLAEDYDKKLIAMTRNGMFTTKVNELRIRNMQSSELFETRRVKIPRIIRNERNSMFVRTQTAANSNSIRIDRNRYSTVQFDENKELKKTLNNKIVAKYANPD